MEEQENLMEVIEEELKELEQFIFDDNQLSYYNEYNLYISNQYAQC